MMTTVYGYNSSEWFVVEKNQLICFGMRFSSNFGLFGQKKRFFTNKL